MGAYTIPDRFLVHTVEIAPLDGHNATGPVHGDYVTHRAHVSQVRKRMGGAGDARERIATLAVHLRPGTVVVEGSLLRYRGRESRVATVQVRDGGGLPVPDHVYLLCE
jgi:hypothetical protein